MDRYRFTCRNAELEVALSVFDAEVLSSATRYAYPGWRTGIFASVRADQAVSLTYVAALADAEVLLKHLEAEQELLPFDYSLQVVRADGTRERAIKERPLRVASRAAMATSGAGIACIDVYEYFTLDHDSIDLLVARGQMWPHEAAVFRKWSMEVRGTELVRDLRDMKPFVSDEGDSITAIRKAHPTNIVHAVRSIVEFLRTNECDVVEVAFLGEPPWG